MKIRVFLGAWVLVRFLIGALLDIINSFLSPYFSKQVIKNKVLFKLAGNADADLIQYKCYPNKKILAWPLLTLCSFFLISPVNAGYLYDLYCKESGSNMATKSCYPAKESTANYSGGSKNYGVYLHNQGENIFSTIENTVNANFGSGFCSPAHLVYTTDWITSVDNDGFKSDTRGFRIDSVLKPNCESVAGTLEGNAVNRDKYYSCPEGAEGPYLGPGGKRFCASSRDMCNATPHPVSIATGIKQFNKLYDSSILADFELSRSFTSSINYSHNTKTNLVGNNNQVMAWETSYDAMVVPGSNSAGTVKTYTVHIPGEIPRTYVQQANGSLLGKQADAGLLSKAADQRFYFRHPQGRLWIFGADGNLQSIHRTNGQGVFLSTANNTFSAVTDTFGRQLGLTYTPTGQLSSITDPAGNVFGYGYTNNGLLEEVRYPNPLIGYPPRKKTYLYEFIDNPGAMTGIVDELGNRTDTFTYGTDWRVTNTQQFSKLGVPTETYSFSYDTPQRTTVTDPLGTRRSYDFVKGGPGGYAQLSGVSKPGGSGCGASMMSTIYDGAGNPFVQTDFKGNASCHFYDTKRNLETTRLEGLSAASCGGYDTIGVTMPNGSRKISTTWHPEWRLETRLAEPLKITTWVYNGQPDPTANNALASCAPINAVFADGKPIVVLCKKIEQSTTDSTGTLAFNAALTGDSRVSTYSYSSLGQLLTVNGPRTDVADTTTFSYYAANASCTGGHFGCRGQISKITNALNQVTQITTYNANGQPTTIIRPNGTTITLTYDARQRVTSRSWGSERTQYTYDAAGQLTNITRPNGSALTYSYDNAHRLIGIKDQLGNRIAYTLDNMGNHVKQDIYDPSNNLTQTHRQEVDALNRLYKDIGANNQTTVFKHDSMDNLTDATDPLNHTTSHNYDSLNRLRQNIDAAGATSNQTLDGRDNTTAVKDPKNNSTQYAYDGLDNLTKEISPDRGTTTYTYDSAGNTKTRINARNQTTTFNWYDALNRPTGISISNSPLPYMYMGLSYDVLGNLSSLRDPYGTTSWTYNNQGRLTNRNFAVGSLKLNVKYAYNAQGQLTSLTYPSGKVLQLAYTSGLLTGINLNTTALLSNIHYQPFGGASDWTYGNGVKNTRYYDLDGRIDSLWLGNATRDITYDAASNIANFKNSDTPVYQEFTYDVVDRLVGHTDYAGTAFTLNYDANGNRTQFKNGSANAVNYNVAATSNRLLNTSQTGGTTKTYTIDATGNTTSDGKNIYTYDGRNRLVQATGPGFATEYYRINGLGQRTAKVTGTAPDMAGDVNQDGQITSTDATLLSQAIGSGTAVNNTVNDCNKDGSVNTSDVTCINTKIADITANPSKYIQTGTYFAYDEAGHLLGEYTQAGSALQETVWLGDIPVAVLNSTGNYYIYPDHLNTPRAIADSTNKTVWRWKDPAFGTSQPDQDPDKDGKVFVYNLRFPGQYYDQSTGLHYNWFRDYDPATGSYRESDPIGLAGGLNTYAYVNGNPVNYTDPKGLYVQVVIGYCRLFPAQCVTAAAAAMSCVDGVTKMFNEATKKPRFIVDSDGETVDTDVTPEGSSYIQPNKGRTDILQGSDHGAGRTHTHDPKINTAPNGDTFINGLEQPGRQVSFDDVQNIKSGTAKPAPPMKR